MLCCLEQDSPGRGSSGQAGRMMAGEPGQLRAPSANTSVWLVSNSELVPAPEIQSQVHPSTLGWCNLTLHCQVPTTAAMNITWGTGDSPQDLARHCVSADGQSLHLALPPGTWNNTYTCSASNPADQKSTSVVVQSLCLSNTTRETCPPGGFRVKQPMGEGRGTRDAAGSWLCVCICTAHTDPVSSKSPSPFKPCCQTKPWRSGPTKQFPCQPGN